MGDQDAHAKARARREGKEWLGVKKEENPALIYLASLSQIPKAKNLLSNQLTGNGFPEKLGYVNIVLSHTRQ